MEDNKNTPKWLVRVQEQSWEPEILISGIVLLILTRMPDQIDLFVQYLKTQTTWVLWFTNLPENLSAFLKVAIYWTIFGLGAHLIMRIIWVSMVGLSYAFPEGIDRDKLNYKGRFADMVQGLPDFPTQIQHLERICSTIYAITFLMFMLMIGVFIAIIALTSTIILWMIIDSDSFMASLDVIDTYLNWAILIITVPYLIDFITLGGLKKIKWIHPIYRPIYRILGVLTLAPIYRPVYYGLVSNLKKRWLITGLIVYTGVSILLYGTVGANASNAHEMYSRMYNQSDYTGYYEDISNGQISRVAHIPSEHVRGQAVRLFAIHNSGLEDSIARACEAYHQDSLRFPSPEGSWEDLKCLNYFYIPVVDQDTIWEPEWWFRRDARYDQRGIFIWLDLAKYDRGKHDIRLLYRFKGDLDNQAFITFWKDSPALTSREELSSESPHSTSDPAAAPTP